MATEKRQVTSLTMVGGEKYIALERLDVMEMKMNGLNVGKSVLQAVTEHDAPAGTYPTTYINLFHVKILDALTHEVPIPDVERPALSYDGADPVEFEYGSKFTLPTVKATDDEDSSPKITSEVKNSSGSVVPTVDTNKPGTYTITYTATDASNNVSEPLSVGAVVKEYVDDVPPEINYVGSNPITLEHGEPFVMPEVSVTDNWDEHPVVSSVITGTDGTKVDTVDTTVPGNYAVIFTAQDASNNKKELTVNVVVNEEIVPEPELEPDPDPEAGV